MAMPPQRINLSPSPFPLNSPHRTGNDPVHIVIPVFSQTATEKDVLFPFGQLSVCLIDGVVPFVVDRVVCLVSICLFHRVLPCDDRPGIVIHRFAERLEMLVFDDACGRCVARTSAPVCRAPPHNGHCRQGAAACR